MNSIKRELDTDAAITFKSLPTFDFRFEFIISFCSFILIWKLIPDYASSTSLYLHFIFNNKFENVLQSLINGTQKTKLKPMKISIIY